MSYCRFSSDNWRCDVYCYESEQGDVTHVASSRIVGDVPVVPFFFSVPQSDFFSAMKKQSDFVNNAEREKIGLEHDGKTFIDSSVEKLYERLESLVNAGYMIPTYVFASLGEEMRSDK